MSCRYLSTCRSLLLFNRSIYRSLLTRGGFAVAMTRVPIAARDLRAQKSNGNADSPSHPAVGEYEGGGALWSASALFERVFWCGDFNYRVNSDYERVKRLLAEGDSCPKRPRNRPIQCQKRPINRPIKCQKRPTDAVAGCRFAGGGAAV